MKAVVCPEPGRLELSERPFPAPSDGLIAIDIKSIGVCGTDFHIFQGRHPYLQYPRVMGHELAAVIADGLGNERFPPGTSVVVYPYLTCGRCEACRKQSYNCCRHLQCLGVHVDGGMCERIVIPERNLYHAGPLGSRDAAMVEFLAVGAHAVRRADIEDGSRILVIGMGPIGIGTALFARLSGADVTVMDVSENRLRFAGESLEFRQQILAGPDAAIEASRRTGGEFFQCVFDATGNARAMETSFAYVGHTGSLVFVGVLDATISFSDAEFHKREMKLLAARNAVKADFDQVVKAIADGKIPTDRINTDTADLGHLPQAMPEWLGSDEPPIKAILTV